MAQRPKGPRRQVGPRLPVPVADLVEQRADALGLSISQFVADVMCAYVGRGDLIRELVDRPGSAADLALWPELHAAALAVESTNQEQMMPIAM